MNILIATDKFKDALDAPAVVDALAAGALAANSQAEIDRCPLGDGGEGTGRVLAVVLDAEQRATDVLDPLGRTRSARWWFVREDSTAIIEMAEASGLWLLEPAQRDATRTTTYGTGQLMRAAIDAGCRRLLLCVGGSATVDGGAGCLQGLGWHLLDAMGSPITEPMTGARLPMIARLTPPEKAGSVDVEILCDVTNPLLGPDGAAPVFAPQKGASPAQVHQLEVSLRHWAEVLADYAMQDLSTTTGAGAAGGLPAGLAATLEARLRSGFHEVAERVRLRQRIAGCDIVFTGEGRLDDQTSAGKVVAGVARLAQNLGKPSVAFVGSARMSARESAPTTREIAARLAERLGLREIVVVTPPDTPLDSALAQTGDNLSVAARNYIQKRM